MKYTLTTLASLLTLQILFAQEGQFSQYFASTSVLNPAFTGTTPNMIFNTNYKRSGNRTSDSHLELMQATFTYPIKRTTSKDFQIGGAGVTFFKESRGFEGIFNAQKVLLNGAYSLKLAKLTNKSVVFGLQGGLVQAQLNGGNLTWGSQFNKYFGYDDTRPFETVSSAKITYPTFNFGVIFTSYDNDNYYIRDKSILLGVSVDNLNEPKVTQDGFGLSKVNRLYKAFGSTKFEMAPRIYIHPSGYVLYSAGNSQINAGLYMSTLVSSPRANTVLLIQNGTWYRLEDSIIVLAGFEINNLRIGGSLDLNASSFDINRELGNSLPSYELSLTYNFDLSKTLSNVSSPIF
jgi:type IX secretion system PorP/SprF family membrane protein